MRVEQDEPANNGHRSERDDQRVDADLGNDSAVAIPIAAPAARAITNTGMKPPTWGPSPRVKAPPRPTVDPMERSTSR